MVLFRFLDILQNVQEFFCAKSGRAQTGNNHQISFNQNFKTF